MCKWLYFVYFVTYGLFHASGESICMKFFRGAAAALILLMLTYVVVLEIILFPARETGLVTVKETRALNLPQDFAADATVWNIVLVSTCLMRHFIGNNMFTSTR